MYGVILAAALCGPMQCEGGQCGVQRAPVRSVAKTVIRAPGKVVKRVKRVTVKERRKPVRRLLKRRPLLRRRCCR